MITCIIRNIKSTNSTPGHSTEVAALSFSGDTHPARRGSSKVSNTWVPLTRHSSVWAPSNMFLSSRSTQSCLSDTRKVTAWRGSAQTPPPPPPKKQHPESRRGPARGSGHAPRVFRTRLPRGPAFSEPARRHLP